MAQPLRMHEAAAAVGLSYERFRKVWPQLCRDDGFPAPIRARVWDPQAIEAWKQERSARAASPRAEPSQVKVNAVDKARRARALLQELRAS